MNWILIVSVIVFAVCYMETEKYTRARRRVPLLVAVLGIASLVAFVVSAATLIVGSFT